jgi:hypothetical protein
MSAAKIGFTADELDWVSWLEIVDLQQATEEQIAVLSDLDPRYRSIAAAVEAL